MYASAGQQYMLDEGVTRATYDDLVGQGRHISILDPIDDESYEHITIGTDTTRLETTMGGKVVIYQY
jgi:hypothetical protein